MSINLTAGNSGYQAFAHSWLESLTAKQINDLSWPRHRFHYPVRIVNAVDMIPLTQKEIQSAASVPNAPTLQLGIEVINKLPDEDKSQKLYMFTGFGAVDEDGFAALTRVNDFWDLKRSMDETIAWLQDSSLHDNSTSSYRNKFAKFLSEHNPLSSFAFKSYYKHDHNLRLSRVSHFRKNERLADDHINAVLFTMEALYRDSSKARFIVFESSFVQTFVDAARDHAFVPLNWNAKCLEKTLDSQDFVDGNPGCDAKAYTVINVDNHWCVLVLDFRTKQVLFGHSMDHGRLDVDKHQYVFDGARRLLESCHSSADGTNNMSTPKRFIRINEWTMSSAPFPVPQQDDGNSCGFTALSAIEHNMSSAAELWTPNRKTFFRVKYLVYATCSDRPVPAEFDTPQAKMITSGNTTMNSAQDSNKVLDDSCANETTVAREKSNSLDHVHTSTEGERPKTYSDAESSHPRLPIEARENNGKAPPPSNHEDVQHYPWIDTVFSTAEEAKATIMAWSLTQNFMVRFGRSRPERGERRIECTKGRLHYPRKNDDPAKHRNRQSARVCCEWAVMLRGEKYEDGPWTVEQVHTHPGANPEYNGHNHPLVDEATTTTKTKTKTTTHFTPTDGLSTEHKAVIADCVRLKYCNRDIISRLRDKWPEYTFNLRRVQAAIREARTAARIKLLSLSYSCETADFLKQLEEKASAQPGWYIAHQKDTQRRITQLFWMSPTQRNLYGRYNDVIFNDTINDSTRFRFLLNVTVGIDGNGCTQVLALALIEGETADAYSWVLQHLLACDNNRSPGVVITEQNAAMDSALNFVLPDSKIIDCGWHMTKSVERDADRHMMKETKERLERARESLSMHEFEEAWKLLLQIAPRGSKQRTNLEKIHQRQERWAGHYVGSLFTAGWTSARCVKNAYNLLKRGLNSESTLHDLPVLTEEILRRRRYEPKFFNSHLYEDFAEILEENFAFLGGFAYDKMWHDRIKSYFERVVPIEIDDIESGNAKPLSFKPHQPAHNTRYLCEELGEKEDGVILSEKEDSSDGDMEDNLDSDRRDGDKAQSAWHYELRQLGYKDVLSKLGRDNVAAVYSVEDTRLRLQELFFVLKDRGYFCTCLHLQRMGTICHHFFAVYCDIKSPLRYHISLIARRWFKEEYHPREVLDLSNRPFIGYEVRDPSDKPSDEYMSSVRNMSVIDVSPSSTDRVDVEVNARRYEMASSEAQCVKDKPAETLEVSDRLEEIQKTATSGYLAQRAGVPCVESPLLVHTKGTPRIKRIEGEEDIQDENARKKARWSKYGN